MRLLANQMWMVVDRRRKAISLLLVYKFGEKQVTARKVRQALELPDDCFTIAIHAFDNVAKCLA
jgi:hypothetical protein